MSSQHHHHDHTTENIKLAFFVNLGFCLIELVGGILTNSVAIISDALHDFGDSVSLGLAWIFQRLSERGPTAKYSYGMKRLSVISSMINSLILAVGSTVIIIESIKRLFQPATVNAKGMLILAMIGIIANGFAFLRLKNGKNVNQKAVSLHMLEDVLGWVAVLVVSIVMLFIDLPILDPLLSIGVAVFVAVNIIGNLKQILNITLQGTPSEIDLQIVEKELRELKGVTDLHDLHLWSLDGENHILTVHLVLAPQKTPVRFSQIRQQARDKLAALSINHTTIEIDCEENNCGTQKCVFNKMTGEPGRSK